MTVNPHQQALIEIRELLESVVCTVGPDRGVILMSHEAPTFYDPELRCQVFKHAYFSPLGDALISLYELTDVAIVAEAGRSWSDIAASAYAAYGHSTGNKNFRGEPMPSWDQLPAAIRTAWEAAVRHASDVSQGQADIPEIWAGWVSANCK